ncbi:nickel pincer cofactor biosynthesis protein LarC [Actinoplanes sp. LDG1-01]|uniref:Nickel pincer cofactor biosynthesis protein LarC n=2 Tax=Paractinoplanes lichenicola TaxID=2802976 RepID=A0ABS1VYP6_9ACTN|nr:nickel pincer cofactor biosynthesis protein LarC [Actinoplanes lichenicola]
MLLGALLDAGASLTVVQNAVDAVSGGTVRVRQREVTRGGLHALKAEVEPLVDDPPHRTWADVRDMLERAGSDTSTATAVFRCLAEAEGRVHGTKPDDVHFHEVGALDAIADVVGCCAALADLGVATVSAGPVALGSGTVRTRHGRLPVPAPAVAELAKGWQVSAGGDGELATPTGLALLRRLARACEPLPPMTLEAIGVGAGTRDPAGHANVVRVLIGTTAAQAPAPVVKRAETSTPSEPDDRAVLLEANVDDLDPRLWPGILNSLLRTGASDAWLVPIVMKKGRPAHTLSVLCTPALADTLRDQIFRDTSTLGVRHSPRGKVALERAFADVTVDDTRIPVKVAHRGGTVVQVMPEFDDVAALARRQQRPERLVLQEALAAAGGAGLIVGSALPENLRPAQ